MMPSWDDAVKWHQANVVSFELMLDVVVEVGNMDSTLSSSNLVNPE
jgi:hypothetical protein